MRLHRDSSKICIWLINARDGINGTIHYRQHSIDKLFNRYGFEEVAYLLIWGHLPNQEEKEEFYLALFEYLEPPPLVVEAVKGFP